MKITDLIDESYSTATEKGWWETPRPLMECLMLIVSEVSEACEEYRVHGMDPTKFLYSQGQKPEGIAAELADVMIRVADLAGHYRIPLEYAIEAKLKYNKTRPHRHGGKIC